MIDLAVANARKYLSLTKVFYSPAKAGLRLRRIALTLYFLLSEQDYY